MEIKGRMTRKRLDRLKAEGLITKSQELEFEAALFLDSKATQKRYAEKKVRVQREVEDALTDAEVRERLRYTDADIEALNESIQNPGRNAMAVQSGLKLKAQINGILEKGGGDGGGVSVVVHTLGGHAPKVVMLESPSVKQDGILQEAQEATDAVKD